MKKLAIIFLAITLMVLSGCWDYTDIENRGYILGIALDPYNKDDNSEKEKDNKKDKNKGRKFETMEMSTGTPVYNMTIQIPIIKQSPTLSVSGLNGSGGEDETKTWQITQSGNSFISMEREMESRSSLFLDYQHLQAVILSDSLARDGLEKVIDFFIRDKNVRNGVGLFIVEGSAKKALEVVPNIEDHAATYLLQIPQNIETSSRIAYNHSLGDTINCMLAKDDFVLPRVDVSKKEIKIVGGALMKRGKMVGWLGELDIESINLIRNMYKGGIIVAPFPGNKKGTITMDINKTKAKIKPIVDGDEVRFDILIKVWGDYAEQTGWDFEDKIDEQFIKDCEKAFAREIEGQCNNTIKKLQKEYNTDALQLNKVLRAEEPAYWEKIKNERDEFFSDIEINVKVEVKIDLVGNIR